VVDSFSVTAGPLRPVRSGDPAREASALAPRRWFLILAPTLAGLLAIVGAAADPAVNQDGAELVAAYADNPDPLQIKSLAYHFAYAFWGVAALMLALLVRRRGSWLANLAAVLAFLGATSVPGFLVVDFYDSAIGRIFGVEGDAQVQDALGDMWALLLMQVSGIAGLLFCLPVAALAAWRAGVLSWWTPVAVAAGIGGGFMVIGANVPGAVAMTAGFAVLSVGLARSAALRDARPADVAG
jgi:hypothetical protein